MVRARLSARRVKPVTSLSEISEHAKADALAVFGAFHTADARTMVLLGPQEPGFWPHVTAQPEFGDKAPDPLDRWSERVIGDMAKAFDARAHFPFGGAPFEPFIDWAIRSGRAWVSPVTLLVHDVAGLFVSYRGALSVPGLLALPALPPCPCESCTDKPCLSACPALGAGGYDLALCHEILGCTEGAECLRAGCAVRRACPVSQSYGRMPQQSAFHMAAFHP